MDLKNLIKDKRLQKGLSMKELAEKVGVSEATISRWESGEIDNMKHKGIINLSKALNIAPNVIMGWESESISSDTFDLSEIKNIININKLKKIPILGNIACGVPMWADENIDGYFIADPEIKADFALRCQGDSMIEAEIYDGDLVFLRRTSDVDSGKIAAVLIEDEATLKKVVKTDTFIILQPENKDYKPIILDNDKEALILGEAVGVYHHINKK